MIKITISYENPKEIHRVVGLLKGQIKSRKDTKGSKYLKTYLVLKDKGDK